MELINYKSIISIAYYDTIELKAFTKAYGNYYNFIRSSPFCDKIRWTSNELVSNTVPKNALSQYEINVIKYTRRLLKYNPNINAFDLYSIVK